MACEPGHMDSMNFSHSMHQDFAQPSQYGPYSVTSDELLAQRKEIEELKNSLEMTHQDCRVT